MELRYKKLGFVLLVAAVAIGIGSMTRSAERRSAPVKRAHVKSPQEKTRDLRKIIADNPLSKTDITQFDDEYPKIMKDFNDNKEDAIAHIKSLQFYPGQANDAYSRGTYLVRAIELWKGGTPKRTVTKPKKDTPPQDNPPSGPEGGMKVPAAPPIVVDVPELDLEDIDIDLGLGERVVVAPVGVAAPGLDIAAPDIVAPIALRPVAVPEVGEEVAAPVAVEIAPIVLQEGPAAVRVGPTLVPGM